MVLYTEHLILLTQNNLLKAYKNIYINYGGIEIIFKKYSNKDCLQFAIHKFKTHFLKLSILKEQKNI